MDLSEKYDRVAEGFSDAEYANPEHYNRRRAEAVFAVGPALPPGATVLDLGCGDASFADEVLARGYRYVGVQPAQEAAKSGQTLTEWLSSHQLGCMAGQ